MIGTTEQKKLGLERLGLLAAHLESRNLGHERFNFNQYHLGPDPRVIRCGTEGCALGECPFVFPDDWDFKKDGDDFFPRLKNTETFSWSYGYSINRDAEDFFFLSGDEVQHLFMPFNQKFDSANLDDAATPAQVATNIRTFVQMTREFLDKTSAPETSNSI